MDLLAMQITENRRQLKTTILYRKDGTWHPSEVSKIINGLMTEVSEHPRHLEYLILFGHHTKDATLKALSGGLAYTATEIVGLASTHQLNPGNPITRWWVFCLFKTFQKFQLPHRLVQNSIIKVHH